MFLRTLKLSNVRCFSDLEIDFSREEKRSQKTGKILPTSKRNRKWTVLLGENGTGKTTILRAAALVTAGSDGLTELLGEPSQWIRNNADNCRISALFRSNDGKERSVWLEIKRGDTRSEVISKSRDGLAPINEAIARTAQNYFVVGYGASRRINGENRSSKEYYVRRGENVATLFDSGARVNPLETWAIDLHYRFGEKGLSVVSKVLDSFLPGSKFAHVDKRNRQLVFATEDGFVPLSGLSDGYQSVAAWVGDLLYRILETFEDYSNPLKKTGLIILDEADLHLHPIWQRKLFGFLNRKLPNFQLLVTTHSPVTAQQADRNEIYYLKRNKGNIAAYRFNADPGELLVSQLLITEVFGLESDESVDAEAEKARYRKLRDKRNRSEKEEEEFLALKEDVRNLVSTQNLGRVEARRLELLESLRAEEDRE